MALEFDTAVDPATFRHALGQFLTGVTVATTRGPNGEPVGMTVNSFASVSLDPPLVILSVARSATSFPAMQAAERYAVHILDVSQESVSSGFARSGADGADKFAGVVWRAADDGLPLLEQHLARLQCTIVNRIPAGDHVLYLGHVDAAEVTGDAPAPLAFFRGRHAALAS
jgi:flavin reductase (DIM6/NTAB) family NADH-FMN oxidoreductase RutF